MSGLVNGFNTTAGAVGNVGNAASVAADQMPVFNNTAASGVNSFNDQAGAMNQTAASGVNSFNDQAEIFNNTVAQGVASVKDVVGPLADPLALLLGIMGPLQLLMMVKVGIDIVQKLKDLINPPPHAVAPENFLKLAAAINAQTAAIYNQTNALYEINTVQMVQNIMGKRELPVLFNENTNELTAFFFYTGSKRNTEELRGLNYFAFDSIVDMFQAILAWNYLVAASKDRTQVAYTTTNTSNDRTLEDRVRMMKISDIKSELQSLGISTKTFIEKSELVNALVSARKDDVRRKPSSSSSISSSTTMMKYSRIYFLDTNPPPMTLPHYDFTDHHQHVRIVSLAKNKCIRFDSMKIGNGCSVRIENLTVCTLEADVSSGGSLYLHQCNVDYIPALTQTLFGYTWQECSLGQDGKLAYEDDDVGWGAYDGKVDQKSRERIGNGKMTYANGCYYEGGFVNNKHEGDKCFFRDSDEDEYEGGFEDGVPHGVGILRSKADGFVDYRISIMGVLLNRVRWSADGKKVYLATMSGDGKLALSEMRRSGRRADDKRADELSQMLTETEISLDKAKELAKKLYKLPVPEHVKGKDELNLSKTAATAATGYAVGAVVGASMVGCVVM